MDWTPAGAVQPALDLVLRLEVLAVSVHRVALQACREWGALAVEVVVHESEGGPPAAMVLRLLVAALGWPLAVDQRLEPPHITIPECSPR